ncbi:MAG: hypothetical protein VB140_02410 [Burkholderia sp.]
MPVDAIASSRSIYATTPREKPVSRCTTKAALKNTHKNPATGNR